MSNVGRPTCQLWFEKNKPEAAQPKSSNFVMNMMLGDIVEAVFKGILKEAGVKYGDSDSVTLTLSDGTEINGTYDLVIDGAVDDVKSASDWSYRNKFDSLRFPYLVVMALAISDSLLAMLKQQANVLVAGG